MLLLLPLACGETLAPPLLAVSTDFDFLTVPWLPSGLGAVAASELLSLVCWVDRG